MAENSMRIMLLVNEFPPQKIAGTAMATQALAERLSAHGHRVMVVVTKECPESRRSLIGKGDYELVWLAERPVHGIGVLWRTWLSWRAALRFRPQIIQGQAVSCGLIAAVIGKLLRIPSICYAQGYDVFEAKPWQQRTEIRWGCGWPDRCLAVTRQLAGEIGRVTGVDDVRIMPHAFTLPEHKVARDEARMLCGIGDGKRMVFCVGRLETFKGHDVLLRAWPDFCKRHPDAILCIAGTGRELEDLQQQVAELGIGGSVRFIGYLSADEVHQWMAAADLFVLPSRSEPFGIVLLEAMAHGLPVVASQVDGIPEVLPADGDTQLVPVDNAEALAQAMNDLFAAGFAPSEANRKHAMRFEWRLQVERFEAIYHQLLVAGGGRGSQ
jgi:glycosyltransferase involved in cell wall biosynthesis